MEITEEILQKAQKILSEREKKRICLAARICPICGVRFIRVTLEDDGGREYWCEKHGPFLD